MLQPEAIVLAEAAAIEETGRGKRTVQLGIQTFFTEPPVYYGPIMAALTIASVPMIIMFLFLQKYYVQGISTSGIKG